ncbi:hypothetical protein JB92DRAFT_2764334 [Gautieria morchelliformis]|nr:hypothetical protein JB92DRAFT_2764334 [Gautieria morchelliformis]
MASDRRIRTAKSGCYWTSAELLDYSITILPCDVPTFFNIPSLPQISVSSEFLTKEKGEDIDDDLIRDLTKLLYLTSSAPDEATVDIFTVVFLSHLRYTSKKRYISVQKDLPLIMCGESTYAKPGVYLSDSSSSILMLLQEDKTVKNTADAIPQLITEVIGAFQYNNGLRRKAKLPPLKEMIIPGILMHGTAPEFYLIPVTEELSKAVILGRPPTIETVVKEYIPEVPRMDMRTPEGMMPLDNRVIIVKCYEAFKRFIPADSFFE